MEEQQEPNLEKYKNYLGDLGYFIRETALEAKQKVEQHRDSEGGEGEFYAGILMAYYGLVSHMRNQAEVFDIPTEDLGLGNLEPDRDLI
jgi:hypothetical protein